MPSGRTHDRITIVSVVPITILFYFVFRRKELMLWFSLSYIFSGLMFGPDLDIYSLQYKRWGIGRWIWLPYQYSLKHRSFFSHGFLIGTVVRLIYLSIIVIVFTIFANIVTQLFLGSAYNWWPLFITNYGKLRNQYLEEVITIFWGLELGAMSHTTSDILVTNLKRLKTKISKTK
ncbi:MAG: metal-binding protein [Candidatus Atelocyanobacterium thalassa]